MRYYSTERPLVPGSFPRQDGEELVTAFDDRVYCEDIGREAYGYIDYAEPLTDEEITKYELVPSGSRIWYCVTTVAYDSGKLTAHITATKESTECPGSTYKSLRTKDVYTDWFNSREAAEKFVSDAAKA